VFDAIATSEVHGTLHIVRECVDSPLTKVLGLLWSKDLLHEFARTLGQERMGEKGNCHALAFEFLYSVSLSLEDRVLPFKWCVGKTKQRGTHSWVEAAGGEAFDVVFLPEGTPAVWVRPTTSLRAGYDCRNVVSQHFAYVIRWMNGCRGPLFHGYPELDASLREHVRRIVDSGLLVFRGTR
jgi:hypothetical protein